MRPPSPPARAMLAFLALIGSGCGADGARPDAGPGADAAPRTTPPPILPGRLRFAPCPDTAAPSPGPEDGGVPDAGPPRDGGPPTGDAGAGGAEPAGPLVVDCGTATVPLDWDDPNPREADLIQVVVRRYRRPATPPAPGPDELGVDLWVLGDGALPAAVYGPAVADEVLAWAPETRVLVPDPRGLGASSPLRCPPQEDPLSPRGEAITVGELSDCAASLRAQWGGRRLDAFRMRQAADDLAALIEATRLPPRPVRLLARGLGAWWGGWLLARHPGVVDGSLLVATPAPLVGVLRGRDEDADGVARRLLDRCGEDPGCRQALGDDPVAGARAGLDRVESCLSGTLFPLDRDTFRQALGELLLAYASLRPIGLAALTRAARCTEDDQAALGRFAATLAAVGFPRPADLTVGSPFAKTLLLADGFGPDGPPSPSELRAGRVDRLATLDVELAYAEIARVWPAGPAEQAPEGPVSPRGPIWLLQGELDPVTPLTRLSAWAAASFREGARVLSVPGGAHGVDARGPGGVCAEVAAQALLAPTPDPEPVDACLAGVDGPRFEADPELVEAWFGTGELWGGGGDGGEERR